MIKNKTQSTIVLLAAIVVLPFMLGFVADEVPINSMISLGILPTQYPIFNLEEQMLKGLILIISLIIVAGISLCVLLKYPANNSRKDNQRKCNLY